MNERSIAYFSMEIALHPAMPTYSGGLGIPAGDTIRSAADLDVSLHFTQRVVLQNAAHGAAIRGESLSRVSLVATACDRPGGAGKKRFEIAKM
jgi:hypothetical protein